MTCSETALSLPLLPRKPVLIDFDGGDLSTDGGVTAVALADQRLRLTERLAAAVADPREPRKVRHSLEALFKERVYLIAQGYADCNDANTLRHDPMVKLAVGKDPQEGPLAGQSTLSRFENTVDGTDLRRLGRVLLESFVERCGPHPGQVVLDFDPFDDPAYGQQQGVLFNGYYDHHCYLPLYFCGAVDGGREHVIGALLRDGRASPVRGARLMLVQTVRALRARFPEVEIIVRGDSAFGVPKMINLCRRLGVKFCFGKAQNRRLHALSERIQIRAAVAWTTLHHPEREYGEFPYRAQSWPEDERVVCKAEVTRGDYGRLKLNPRFVVTNLEAGEGWTTERVYAFYSQRGEPENRIKEFKLDLAADRLSCERFGANQFRLVLHVAAYILCQALQDALAAVAPGTEWAHLQVGTLQAKLLKIAARVIVRCRAIRVQLPTSYPWQGLWRQLLWKLLSGTG